jgi:hypothetical protein
VQRRLDLEFHDSYPDHVSTLLSSSSSLTLLPARGWRDLRRRLQRTRRSWWRGWSGSRRRWPRSRTSAATSSPRQGRTHRVVRVVHRPPCGPHVIGTWYK